MLNHHEKIRKKHQTSAKVGKAKDTHCKAMVENQFLEETPKQLILMDDDDFKDF